MFMGVATVADGSGAQNAVRRGGQRSGDVTQHSPVSAVWWCTLYFSVTIFTVGCRRVVTNKLCFSLFLVMILLIVLFNAQFFGYFIPSFAAFLITFS